MTGKTKIPRNSLTTWVPDIYVDLMPQMSNAEVKVMGAAIGNTLTEGKRPEPMSRKWFIQHTGLSVNTVKKGIAEAIERGWLIQLDRKDESGARLYALNLPDMPDLKQPK